jgi:ParB family chromosome partitioning protein
MPTRKTEGPYREIPLELIDQPALAIRETFDQDKLEELILSIQELGVLQPIAVEQHGGRYRILAGHRRYVASLRAGLKTIPAVIRDTTQVDGVAVTSHENAFREDVNPAEEARYLAELLESRCGGDVDRLCALTRQTRTYVESRLVLLRGDPDVFEALRQNRISMAVARELNRVEDRGYRMMYLDAAIRGGATARVVQEWRTHANLAAPMQAPDSPTGENQWTGMPAPVTAMTCICCGSAEEPWAMELIPVHRRCRGMFLDAHLARIRGVIRPEATEEATGGTAAPHPQ